LRETLNKCRGEEGATGLLNGDGKRWAHEKWPPFQGRKEK